MRRAHSDDYVVLADGDESEPMLDINMLQVWDLCANLCHNVIHDGTSETFMRFEEQPCDISVLAGDSCETSNGSTSIVINEFLGLRYIDHRFLEIYTSPHDLR